MYAIYINCREHDYVKDILMHIKVYETRNRRMLDKFVGQRVGIIRSGKGKPKIVGYVNIDKVVAVESEYEWETMRPKTRVSKGSKYDWKGRKKYLYKLSHPVSVEWADIPKSAKRFGRTYIEM